MNAPENRFQRLVIVHAAMLAGETAMVVALADSFFFNVDPNGARSRVLAFLLVSFAPFVVIAPMIGPFIDRVRGGRRTVVELVAAARFGVQVLMVMFGTGLILFPLVFVALVLQKTYTVSKQALVPSVVDGEHQLVEANSKLGLIAGATGALVIVPAAIMQRLGGTPLTQALSAVFFVLAFVAAFRLPRGEAAEPDEPSAADAAEAVPSIEIGWAAMLLLRAAVGFMLFQLAFWSRDQGNYGRLVLGLGVVLASLGTLIGNATATRIRRRFDEERMMLAALTISALAGGVAAIVGGGLAGAGLALVVNLAATVGRMSFESTVQRDGTSTNRGEAFAKFETRFQLGWVIAAVIPVMFALPARVGYLLVASVLATAALNYLAAARRFMSRSPGRSTDRGRRSRSGSVQTPTSAAGR